MTPANDAARARALCDYFAVDAELAEHPVDGCQWCAAILAAFGEVRAAQETEDFKAWEVMVDGQREAFDAARAVARLRRAGGSRK